MEKDLRALRIDRRQKQPSSSGSNTWRVVLSIVLLVIVLAAGGYYFFFRGQTGETDTVATALASDQPDATDNSQSSEVLIISGYVAAHHKIQVGSKVMGKVAFVGIEKGDHVRKGQLLVKLDDREYVARLQETEAGLEAAKARLAELEAGSRPEEIQRAEAELERTQAELRNARLELVRLESLLEARVVSRQQVDNARSRVEIAEATVQMAEKNYELLKQGPRLEEIDRARAEVNRARANLEYAKTLLDATEIRAPIAGTVLERIAEAGEMVTTSFAGEMGAKSAVVALADLNDLQVELDISQSDFNRISKDLECRMSPEAYPEREYLCQIAEVSPEANRQKATIQVKVQVLEPDDFLRPEMTARVTFSKGLRDER